MSGIVRIMPKEPIAATYCESRVDGTVIYQAANVTGCMSIGGYEYANSDVWVEVTEYVWDGAAETADQILAATEHIRDEDGDEVFVVGGSPPSRPKRLIVYPAPGAAGFVFPRGWRIRVEGDTFSIHPPKDGDA